MYDKTVPPEMFGLWGTPHRPGLQRLYASPRDSSYIYHLQWPDLAGMHDRPVLLTMSVLQDKPRTMLHQARSCAVLQDSLYMMKHQDQTSYLRHMVYM